MCGIVGMVGAPKDAALSYNLVTNLMKETKRRGRDASGHFCVNLEGNCEIFKLPVATDQYVRLGPWQRVADGTTALIGHARWTTSGSAKNNDNNHPFVTGTGNLALVHNGVVKDYSKHKSDFKLQTQCDSEILLHTIAKQKNIIGGIKKIFEVFGEGGDFACEVIYRNPKTGVAKFFFFREPGRPGYFIDCREQLGQYFFCSDDDIWKDAIQKAGLMAELKDVKPVEIPSYEIWAIDSQTMEIQKTKIEGITKRKTYTSYVGGTVYGGDWEYGTGTGTTSRRSVSSTPAQTNTHNSSLADDPKLLEKLGPGWTKSTNDLGQLVLIYDDEEAKKPVVEKTEEVDAIVGAEVPDMDKHIKEVEAGILDTSLRWPGWEQEAESLGLLKTEGAGKIPLNQTLSEVKHDDIVKEMTYAPCLGDECID